MPSNEGIPRELLEDRGPVLARTVAALPSPVLEALVRGIARHERELVTGRLFKSADGGGCAVGVALRELEPADFRGGRLRFWLRHGWRRSASSYRTLRDNPRLRHLQWTFDDAVRLTSRARPALFAREAARLVGLWFRDAALAEQSRREAIPIPPARVLMTA